MVGAGYGFVQTSEGEFFVPASKMGGAFNGDEVELTHGSNSKRSKGQGNKPSARVVKVLSRANESLIGRFEVAEPFGVVIPDDPKIPYDIFTRLADAPHVRDGDVVRVRITSYPTRQAAASGVIEEVIGHIDDSGLEVEVIIARHDLETVFSDASIEQAKAAQVGDDQALAEGYRDVRDRTIFTVDPPDARDFDDALSLDRIDGLWRLGVHIADVSYYVPWGSSIDLDARRRATSVYLVDRAIPMLPEELSSDICSLRPHEARRAFSVDIFLTDAFEIDHYDIFSSLIESKERLTYAEVQELLDSGSFPRKVDEEDSLIEVIGTLNEIALALTEKRQAAGGIEFDTKEAKVILDAEGTPQGVSIRERTQATAIVEEAMILANRVIAKHLRERELPGIYRVHEAPSPEDLAELVPILQEFSYLKTIPTERFIAGDPFCIQDVLHRAKGKPESELLSSLILRSMKRAVYSELCSEHYGLAAPEYLHFTSPIRRYPDLVVHRIVKAQLGRKPETFEQQVNSLGWLAEHSSKMERIAEAAGRESQEMKLAELMMGEIGNVFEARISGVASYGLFVKLDNTAEGLVSVRSMGEEYFLHDRKKHTLTGQDSGRSYRLGQTVKVQLQDVDPHQPRLDFILVG